MSGDTEVTTVIIQSQLWLLLHKEKQLHFPFLPGCRKHFTTIKFQLATDLFDRSSAFSLSPSLLRCVKTVQTFPAKLYHSVSPAAQLKHQSLHCFLNTADSNPGSSPAVPLHSTLQQHFKDKAPGSKRPAASQGPGQAEPCQVLPVLQDSHNALFKRNLFPSVPKARDTHGQSTLVQVMANSQPAKALQVNYALIYSVQGQF